MKGRGMISSLSLLLSVKSILAAQIPCESLCKGSSLLFAVFINDIDIPADTEMLYPHLQVWIGILEIA
jgi:hypothetical protein